MKTRQIVGLLTWIMICTGSVHAQVAGAQLSGTVTDSSGARVPAASLTLKETQTNTEMRTNSDSAGSYLFFPVKPGIYQFAVAANGFDRVLRDGVRVVTGERIRVDFQLQAGQASETVNVRADAPLLRSDSANLGQVIDNQKVIDLPLNGRSFITLAGLSAGVALPPNSVLPRINGGRPRTNEYLYDGISVLQPEPGTIAFTPVIDSIQEFKVETNSPSAEFGRFNGGVVNLTMKSGTNDWHGSIFEFLRNEALNARNLFAPATSASPGKPRFRRNQYGFVAGGPIQRDKTFVFLDYQGSRQSIARVRTSTVPTLAQRQGIFSGATIYDPSTTRFNGQGAIIRDPFPSNTIPLDRIDPVALALLDRYPLPTTGGAANNYTRSGNEGDAQDQGDLRADRNFGRNDRAFLRLSRAVNTLNPVTPFTDGSGALTSGALGHTRTVGDSLASSYLHTFGLRMTNDVRVGYTRRKVALAAFRLPGPASSSLGIPGIPANAAFQSAMPMFVLSGFQQLGPPASAYSDSQTDVTEVADTLSFQYGRHFFKAGLDFRQERMNIVQPPAPTGSFTFSAVESGLPGQSSSGSAFASFLLGQVDRYSIDLQQNVLRPRATIQEYFLQDDWNIAQKVKITAGVRYTLNFPSTEATDQGSVFNLATQQLEYLGKGDPRSARVLHKLNFGPRLGVAYQAADKTVIRSGYGLVWIEMSGITTPFTNPYFPFLQTVSQRSLDSVNPAFILSAGPSVVASAATPDAALGQGAFAVTRSLGSGYVQQWNLSIQRELFRNTLLELAYTGSKITHVGIPDTNINQLTVQQLAIGSPLLSNVANPFFGIIPPSSSLGGSAITQAQLLKPYPKFTNVSLFRNNVGNTNYNAFQLKLDQQLWKGLSTLVSYSFSKLLDDASSVFDSSVISGPTTNYPAADSYNRKLERDVSTGDIPNNLVASMNYLLPFGHGHGFLGGWQISGIVTLQSGLPLAVTQTTNFNAFAGFGVQRPNLVADPTLGAAERSVARYFNTAAFTIAPQFTLGTSSRNPVRGPAYRNADIALIKRTHLGEQTIVEFRSEVFNLTNTPPLGAPGVVAGTAAFGSITSAGDPRVIQLGLKVTY